MKLCFIFLAYLPCVVVKGVFGDEVKSVSVMEGQNVTLHTDVVKQRDDLIVWYYVSENKLVARFNGEANSIMLSDDERFKDRVKMNDQTGDLIITHITSQHSGLYTLRISRNNKVSHKKFNLTVYARLTVPVISRNSSQCSNCSVLCSVMNVSHDVSVSWYNESSVHSSISVSDLNIRLSLPLEVEYQDTNTYRCVLNNPITNLTQHLHITQLCLECSESPAQQVNVSTAVAVSCAAVFCLIIIISIIVYMKKRKVSGKSSESENGLTEEKRSINGSSTCEDEDASEILNEKQHR